MTSKIGNIYTYIYENTMLEIAEDLENQGYVVKRYKEDNILGNMQYKVEIIGYK